jgi:hypothetical protein
MTLVFCEASIGKGGKDGKYKTDLLQVSKDNILKKDISARKDRT